MKVGPIVRFISISGCTRFLTSVAMVVTAQFLTASGAGAYDAYVARDSTVQAGPGVDYPQIATVAHTNVVEIKGCLEALDWCDIASATIRGWVLGKDLEYSTPGARVSLAQAWIRIPIVVYVEPQ